MRRISIRLSEEERQRRLDALLARRRRIAEEQGFAEEDVQRDVAAAVRKVRSARAARRR